MATPLDRNLEAYERQLPELLLRHEGEFVLMQESRVVNFFPTYEAALEAGYAAFRRSPFFVSRIAPMPKERVDLAVDACPH
jgi:hypothetical protein